MTTITTPAEAQAFFAENVVDRIAKAVADMIAKGDASWVRDSDDTWILLRVEIPGFGAIRDALIVESDEFVDVSDWLEKI